VAIAALLLLLTVAHEWGHWRAGERPDFSSHVIDLMHATTLLWVLVNACRWSLARTEQ
jgi:hypothetical protein